MTQISAINTPHARAAHTEDNSYTDIRQNAAASAEPANTVEMADSILKHLEDIVGDVLMRSEMSEKTDSPKLSEPEMQFSADEVVSLLRTMRDKLQNQQLENAMHEIDRAQMESDQAHELSLEKLEEWIDKCKDAKNTGFWGKLFGWIGKIAAVVASLAAVVALSAATGGAATPLLVAASLTLITSSMSLLNEISQEFGGPEISINNLLQSAIRKTLQAVGVPEKSLDQATKIAFVANPMLSMPLVLIEPSLLGEYIGTICELCGVDEQSVAIVKLSVTMAASIGIALCLLAASGGASVAAESGKIVQLTAKIANTSGQIISGAADVGKGASEIITAKHQYAADKALIDKEKFQALMLALQATMEEEKEQIKKVVQEMEEALSLVTKIISELFDNVSQITNNLGTNRTV